MNVLRHHQAGVFWFQCDVGTLPSFMAHFQVSDILGRGGFAPPPMGDKNDLSTKTR